MKTTGVIAEYNPFHKGHLFQFEQIRLRTGADYIAVAMSGDFVQRGEPAIFDKYTRASMALACGADLVLELPAAFATGSAEDFASGGVALFDRLGVVDTLCFGSECGQLEPLTEAARFLIREPECFSLELQGLLKQGYSFPAARAAAMQKTLGGAESRDGARGEAILTSPNNILAVEYLKALLRRQSRIQPMTIRREGQGYHDSARPEPGIFASASALRRSIRETAGETTGETGPDVTLARQMPSKALEVLKESQALTAPIFADDLSLILQYRLLELMRGNTDPGIYADLSGDLAARLMRSALSFASFSGRIEQLKTRQYTYTRVSRALLHLILGLTDEQMRRFRQADYAPYGRVLGFRRSAGPLLGMIKKQSSIPLITKTADAGNILTGSALEMLQTDFHASHLYQSLVFSKGRTMENEYTKSVIVFP